MGKANILNANYNLEQIYPEYQSNRQPVQGHHKGLETGEVLINATPAPSIPASCTRRFLLLAMSLCLRILPTIPCRCFESDARRGRPELHRPESGRCGVEVSSHMTQLCKVNVK